MGVIPERDLGRREESQGGKEGRRQRDGGMGEGRAGGGGVLGSCC